MDACFVLESYQSHQVEDERGLGYLLQFYLDPVAMFNLAKLVIEDREGRLDDLPTCFYLGLLVDAQDAELYGVDIFLIFFQ